MKGRKKGEKRKRDNWGEVGGWVLGRECGWSRVREGVCKGEEEGGGGVQGGKGRTRREEKSH